MIADYEKKVYAAVLGKVLGVYAGRPFEGWPKERLAERFGVVDRYVNEDLGCPDVVVVDDDVSGTLTFVRALADSGAYAATSPAAFGECWLNYLLENQTVLWWGGFGRSTEHTAFLRLKSGVPAPRSGSMALNGRTVSEQIGAQIFIDAFGMVAPGRPEEAARLAKMAAQVSHDGEAVYAAQVVAAMVSVAFVESDMEKILDRGVACVPADCLIARLHREVRAWAREDGDWQRTYERIAAKYGYDKFGGCCHVVPNHALMVMAWAYAGADFHRAMQIVNTAGWDTDCNAGNVGCVCALAAGLEHLADGYDYDAPVAGRVVIGAAEGSMTTADVLRQAQMIARIGRRVMGWPDAPAPKGGAWMHFSQPGARQGWLPDESAGFPARGNAATANPDGAGLRLRFSAGPGKLARAATLAGVGGGGGAGGYGRQGTPDLYDGVTVTVRGRCLAAPAGAALRPYLRTEGLPAAGLAAGEITGPACALAAGADFALTWTLSGLAGRAAALFGLEVVSPKPGDGEVFIDRVERRGRPEVVCADGPVGAGNCVPGWITNADDVSKWGYDGADWRTVVKNGGTGLLVTGDRSWQDAELSCRFRLNLGEAGAVVNYQGARRYHAVLFDGEKARLVRQCHGVAVLAAAPCPVGLERPFALKVACRDGEIVVTVDGKEILRATDRSLCGGGAGFACGLANFAVRAVEARGRLAEEW